MKKDRWNSTTRLLLLCYTFGHNGVVIRVCNLEYNVSPFQFLPDKQVNNVATSSIAATSKLVDNWDKGSQILH